MRCGAYAITGACWAATKFLLTGDVTEFENGFVTASSHAGGRDGGDRVDLRTTGGYAKLRSRSTEADALECRSNSVDIWRLRNPVCHLRSDDPEVRMQVQMVISGKTYGGHLGLKAWGQWSCAIASGSKETSYGTGRWRAGRISGRGREYGGSRRSG